MLKVTVTTSSILVVHEIRRLRKMNVPPGGFARSGLEFIDLFVSWTLFILDVLRWDNLAKEGAHDEATSWLYDRVPLIGDPFF